MTDFVNPKNIPPLQADGQDIIVIKAAIVDQQGYLVPLADNRIDFSVTGNGKIVGVGNGNIASHEPNKATHRKAYNGLCAVIVQSTPEAGEIIVTASSPELVSAKISINSVSSKVATENNH
jgi:beta-galactosidase